ncbi:MAG: hypothetical protein IJK56_00520 [Firmicutes bacterium]|nr:hypothetical protein [Bacillota bacterium]
MNRHKCAALLLCLMLGLTGCTGQTAVNIKDEASAVESMQEVTESMQADADNEQADADNEQAAAESSVAESSTEPAEVSTEPADTSTESSEISAADDTSVYDTSAQLDAQTLSDGEAIVGGTYTATEEDQSVLEASGTVTASVTGSVLNKMDGGASSADGSSFYGINAAVRVYDQATVMLEDCEINAYADNATGVFAYDGGTVYISDSTVTVTGGGAGGIQVAGGGTLYAGNLTVTSASKAAIRSDRGGGYLEVDGGTYTSTGKSGCPAVYSTADILVQNATLVSEQSRGVIIEGKNSVTLIDCDLTGNDQSTKEGSVHANVLLYQSASGDASVGTSEFTMSRGSMTSLSGAMFYCTNTASIINLEDVELISDDENLLIVSTGRWGKDGSNGGDCTFNATSQTLNGIITVDDISSLTLNLTASDYTGAINPEGEAGEVNVVFDTDSTWTLTADSHITSFTGDTSQITANGYHLYVNGEAIV